MPKGGPLLDVRLWTIFAISQNDSDNGVILSRDMMACCARCGRPYGVRIVSELNEIVSIYGLALWCDVGEYSVTMKFGNLR